MHYPTDYEKVDGGVISPRWKGREVPVPPEWARNWSSVTRRYKYASLAKDLENQFPAPVRQGLVEYVKTWPQRAAFGQGLIIAGNVPHARRVWAASAVINEITMRYGPRANLTTAWLSVRSGLTWLMDARERRAEEYVVTRNKLLRSTLVLIDNPLLVKDGSEAEWFLRAVYEHRFEQCLPTITTLSFGWDDTAYDRLAKTLGRDVAYYLVVNDPFIVDWDATDG